MSVESVKTHIESLKKSLEREREAKKRDAEAWSNRIKNNPKSPSKASWRAAKARYAANFDKRIERLKNEIASEKEHLAREREREKANKK